jgi:hypothetical protein
MSAVAALLDPEVQSDLRQALSAPPAQPDAPSSGDINLGQYRDLLAETLAALTIAGQYPAELRWVALTLMPRIPREELQGRRLVEYDPDWPSTGRGRVGWRLTSHGERLANVLAAAAPAPTPEADEQAKEALERRIAESEATLGLEPQPQDSTP